MYKLKVVLRYLKSKRITFFSIASVAIGVMALVIVLGVMRGFGDLIRKVVRGNTSDIILRSTRYEGFSDYHSVMTRLDHFSIEVDGKKIDPIVAYAPRFEGFGILHVKLGGQIFMKPCQFIGIDPKREWQVSEIRNGLLDPASDDFTIRGVKTKNPGIILGSDLARIARNYDLKLTDEVKFITLTDLEADPAAAYFNVTNIYTSGYTEIDKSTALMSLKEAQNLRKVDDTITSINIKLTDYKYAAAVKTALSTLLDDRPHIKVLTWEDTRQTLLTAIGTETSVMAVILFFFLVVAGFGTTAILWMIALQKFRDIGILKALGASVRGIMKIFLLCGFLIGFVGSVIGTVGGWLFLTYLDNIEVFVKNVFGIDPFSRDIYNFDRIPREINPLLMFVVGLFAVAISFLFSTIPAYKAARMNPVEALRYE